MGTELATINRTTGEITEIAVLPEQVDLIKRTIAKDATNDELQLYFYDCKRQGVHPLDKLIHFTKRKGKYTPITSIDFMRMRAAETGEFAGCDEPVFTGLPGKEDFKATVTVYRIVKGLRCAFVGVARWDEFYPGDGEQSFMWRKMPHNQLAKCAEAQGLRKGFPKQLAGLYAKEEMDQAGPTETATERPAITPPQAKTTVTEVKEEKAPPPTPPSEQIHYVKNPDALISEAQKRLIFARLKKSALNEEDFKQTMRIEHITDLTMGRMNEALELIEKNPIPI